MVNVELAIVQVSRVGQHLTCLKAKVEYGRAQGCSGWSQESETNEAWFLPAMSFLKSDKSHYFEAEKT